MGRHHKSSNHTGNVDVLLAYIKIKSAVKGVNVQLVQGQAEGMQVLSLQHREESVEFEETA